MIMEFEHPLKISSKDLVIRCFLFDYVRFFIYEKNIFLIDYLQRN